MALITGITDAKYSTYNLITNFKSLQSQHPQLETISIIYMRYQLDFDRNITEKTASQSCIKPCCIVNFFSAAVRLIILDGYILVKMGRTNKMSPGEVGEFSASSEAASSGNWEFLLSWSQHDWMHLAQNPRSCVRMVLSLRSLILQLNMWSVE